VAETGHRARLRTGAGAASRVALWCARLGSVLSIGLICAVGVHALRVSGFEFRWDTGDEAPAAAGARIARPVPVAASASLDDTPPATAARRTETTVLEPPNVGDDPGPVATGAPARIDFESFGDGGARCTPCAVTDEWASDGLRVSFRSWTADAITPYLLDGRDYVPPEVDSHVLGPAFGPKGLEVGVIQLDFPGRPRMVSFTLYGPDIVPYFAVTGWTGDRILSGDIQRTGGRTYDVTGRGLFREERISVTAESGIDRVSLDGWGPPGHLLLVDDLVITP
jgi:hypothetical protein